MEYLTDHVPIRIAIAVTVAAFVIAGILIYEWRARRDEEPAWDEPIEHKPPTPEPQPMTTQQVKAHNKRPNSRKRTGKRHK